MTILIAVFIGAIAAVVIGMMMPVKQVGGLKRRMIVGVLAAVLGSIAAIACAGGSVMPLDAQFSLIALIAALYALFAHQCVAMRYQ